LDAVEHSPTYLNIEKKMEAHFNQCQLQLHFQSPFVFLRYSKTFNRHLRRFELVDTVFIDPEAPEAKFPYDRLSLQLPKIT
jgi:hypothetical protein